jgi:hypothetical protein
MLHPEIKLKSALSGSSREGLRAPGAAIGAAIRSESGPDTRFEGRLMPLTRRSAKAEAVVLVPRDPGYVTARPLMSSAYQTGARQNFG